MELNFGRMIDHVHLVVRDLDASRRFYEAVLGVLGIPVNAGRDHFQADELWVATGTQLTGRIHLAFQAKDRETVDRVYQAALAAGAKDNGRPGERPYHPGYYAAYILDPDGNNIEAVYHGPGRRSAPSVVITPDMPPPGM